MLLAGQHWADPGATNCVDRDVDFANVEVLLHMDGPEGSGTITDVKGHTVTRSNSWAWLTVAQAKFGGASLYTAGSPVQVQITGITQPGTGDYTIECWLKTDYSFPKVVTDFRSATQPHSYYYVYSGGIGWYSGTDHHGTTAPTPNVWSHFAWVKSGAVLKMFANGVLDAATPAAETFDYTGTSMLVTGAYDFAAASTGWMDDYRYTRGVARYSANFIPPTRAFPNV